MTFLLKVLLHIIFSELSDKKRRVRQKVKQPGGRRPVGEYQRGV